MTEIDEIAAAIREASWPARIAVIRTIPERFGTSQHAEVYAAIGAKFYAPDLKPELEDAVEDLFNASSVKFVRTGSDNQQEIERRFGLTVKPAPDFAIYDTRDSLRAILECKNANDGGTARDKASRFRSLRAESMRLGGIPLFGILSGLGWRRTRDALGPVIRDTDGRVFTLTTLSGILAVDPFPQLVAAT
jgi:hypothetical protein